MNLYSIADQYRELSDGDLDAETIADTLEGIDGMFEEKAQNVAHMVANLEAEAAAAAEAAKKMSARSRATKNKADRLREYLKTQMERVGKSVIKSDQVVVKIKNNPPKLVVDNQELIPEEFTEKEVVTKLLTKSIKAHLESQDEEWAHLEQGTRLDIK